MPPSRHSKASVKRVSLSAERTHEYLVGRLREQAGVKLVTPEDDRFLHDFDSRDQLHGAQFGQFVVVQLDTFPELNRPPVGHVVDVVGAASDPGIEVQIAVRTHDLPYEFSEEAIAQARAFGDSIDPTIADMRMDLRDYRFVTIDGEDARDFDDAVYAARRGKNGWTLWVAIADVANYVTENSPLDQTAIERGTSVYFPSEVIPMLPETLSNGLCSLNPHVDRLALAVCLEIASTGRVTSYRFHEVVFQSQQRLTYKQVQDTWMQSRRTINRRLL